MHTIISNLNLPARLKFSRDKELGGRCSNGKSFLLFFFAVEIETPDEPTVSIFWRTILRVFKVTPSGTICLWLGLERNIYQSIKERKSTLTFLVPKNNIILRSVCVFTNCVSSALSSEDPSSKLL